jgi:hypothetical protein
MDGKKQYTDVGWEIERCITYLHDIVKDLFQDYFLWHLKFGIVIS